jgi:hypothetical protein
VWLLEHWLQRRLRRKQRTLSLLLALAPVKALASLVASRDPQRTVAGVRSN